MRLIRPAITALLLGSLTTLGVSWSFAIALQTSRVRQTGGFRQLDVHDKPNMSLYRSELPGAVKLRLATGFDYSTGTVFPPPTESSTPPEAFVPEWARPIMLPLWVPYDPQHREDSRGAVMGAGWPLTALYCTLGSQRRTDREDALALPDWITTRFNSGWDVFLPCAVLPAGLALDSACFASGWFALLIAPALRRTFRASLRSRRNLCPRCAYSLTGLAPNSPCPECGHAPPHTP